MNEAEKIIQQVKILCETLSIKDNIICLLHYGSVKIKEDYNRNSDLDFHLVLKKIDAETLNEIKNIFSFSEKIDLSIHSLDEVIYKNNVIFQNGNQGIYFTHVLAAAEVLIGDNLYINLVNEIDIEKVNLSILEKIRYYVWLLRRNYISRNDINVFKKYSIRILKDILILEKNIDYSNIASLSSRQVVNMFVDNHKNSLSVTQMYLLVNLVNLDQIKSPEISSTIVLIAELVNKIVWENI